MYVTQEGIPPSVPCPARLLDELRQDRCHVREGGNLLATQGKSLAIFSFQLYYITICFDTMIENDTFIEMRLNKVM